ncbi:hypothetical protein RJ640_020102 [Escallonia rubra]|uniref:Alginate lyase 2 domain-containing protein n=1 Tax=Escallonia rubra TaxID=112253 RepID=A0AA88RCS1_9ASTE|nr:hypothetical protein RJ640_020102 [Escallonia rubra]
MNCFSINVLPYVVMLGLLESKLYCMLSAADPTDGFINVPLAEENFELQKPYDIPLAERYSCKNGVHRLWVYADDKPHENGSLTQPRTEIRISGLDYSSGVWQFEGYAFVPNGTSGATIVQIHGASHGNTTILLRIYEGNMRYYSSELVTTNLYDKWFRVNLIHNVDEGQVTVFIDSEQQFQHKDQGPGDLYFKCGVYGAPNIAALDSKSFSRILDQERGREMNWFSIKVLLHVVVVGLFQSNLYCIFCSADPTDGFINVPLTEENFELQKPYDIPLAERYSYENGIRRLWVYADDKPHENGSLTQPRTEIRISGLDYSSGVWQFEGYAFVPNGTSGATIVQIHGASHGNTTILLRIYEGNMRYYSSELVTTNLYDKWFRVNLIHDVDGGKVTVFIDGDQKFEHKDQGPGDLHFKCGVYGAPTTLISLTSHNTQPPTHTDTQPHRGTMNLFYCSVLVLTLQIGLLNHLCSADPTDGFTNVPLTADANFELQKPYDIPLSERYSYENGVHKLWVYADDKPHDPNSHTQPRTEIRIRVLISSLLSSPYSFHLSSLHLTCKCIYNMHGLDYSSGVWQFEGYSFVPNGTSGATIVQIHGASHGATTIILRIYDGDMRFYSGDLVTTDLYDKWFRVNLIHDVDGGLLTVFIDGEQKFQHKDQGPGDLYFKCGVYAAPSNISYYMESRWRDIRIYRK